MTNLLEVLTALPPTRTPGDILMPILVVTIAIGLAVAAFLIIKSFRTKDPAWIVPALMTTMIVFAVISLLVISSTIFTIIGCLLIAVGFWFLRKNWGNKNRFFAGIAVAAIALPYAAGLTLLGTKFVPVTSAVADGIESVAFDPTVDFLPAEAKCTTNYFMDHSLRILEVGNKDRKQSSTAVSIPFKGNTDAEVFKEFLTEICGNPTVLEMTVNEMLLWDSKQIPGADENKVWLSKIKADIKDNEFGISSFVTKTPANILVVTPAYQKYATWINAVLLRSAPQGKQSLTSVRNWELPAIVDPSKGLPSVVKATEQENKPAYVRAFVSKMGTCLLRFGFNAEDRRWETFKCQTANASQAAPKSTAPVKKSPEKSTPKTSVTPNHETPKTETSTPTKTPTKTSTPSPTPTKTPTKTSTPSPTPSVTPTCPPDKPNGTWPICKDSPTKDPEQQGNNKPGGGGKAPAVTEPASPPAAGNPPATYTPPAWTQSTAPTIKPSTLPSSSPAPTVAPSTQPVNNGEIVPLDPSESCSTEAREFGLC